MPTNYQNKEYIDHIEDLLTDTILEGSDRVSEPFKMNIRDMAVLVSAEFNGDSVVIEYSPDEMETRKDDLVPANMSWFSRADGTFTDPAASLMKFWENIEGAEGWFRVKVVNPTAIANLKVSTRPRVEKALT